MRVHKVTEEKNEKKMLNKNRKSKKKSIGFRQLDIPARLQCERAIADPLEEETQDRRRTIRRSVAGQYQYRVSVSASVMTYQAAQPRHQAKAFDGCPGDLR